MADTGIDLSEAFHKPLTDDALQGADIIGDDQRSGHGLDEIAGDLAKDDSSCTGMCTISRAVRITLPDPEFLALGAR